jgi:GT2 family glycosyltransferase
MLAALRHDPGIGAIAPLELDASGRLRSSGMRFLTPFNHALGLLGVRPHRRGAGRGRGLAPDDAQWVPAAALLTSTALFRSVGGFDEAYVFYEEDEDFCWRLQRRGYRVAICAQATIAHPGKGSASLAAHWSTLSLYRGQSIFLQRRLGSGAAIGYRFATSAALVAKSFFGKVGKQADARCAHPSVPSVLGALWLRRPVETDTKAA